MGWKRMKGMLKAVNKCPKCRGLYPDEDYDLVEDKCLFCLFPEASRHTITPINNDMGFPRNRTPLREVLDDLDRIPEVQSEEATIKATAYKTKKYVKKRKL